LEPIEDRARRGLPIDSEVILTLTAYLREVLQAKVNAEAVAYEALKKAGIIVLPPSPALESGMAKIGAAIAKEWAASAGAEGEAMLAAFKK